MRDAGLMMFRSGSEHELRGRLAEASRRSFARYSFAGLLERFYARAGLKKPRFDRLKGQEVPEPYKKLLVHSSDMTPTLESFYDQSLSLTVLAREVENDHYYREVTLNLSSGGRPVEYGAIQIYLEHFPSRARERVLSEQCPLGKILEIEEIGHVSWPQAFFCVRADERMKEVLRMRKTCDLFGRRNVLLDGDRRLLAQVIEVLAPPEGAGTRRAH
jgi:hypothetical protein